MKLRSILLVAFLSIFITACDAQKLEELESKLAERNATIEQLQNQNADLISENAALTKQVAEKKSKDDRAKTISNIQAACAEIENTIKMDDAVRIRILRDLGVPGIRLSLTKSSIDLGYYMNPYEYDCVAYLKGVLGVE